MGSMRSFTVLICFIFLPFNTNNAEYNRFITKEKYHYNIISINFKDTIKRTVVDTVKNMHNKTVKNIFSNFYSKFSEEDKEIVTKICNKYNIKEKDFYRLIYKESRGNTKAVNKYSKATGIIQFLPSTAKSLNTTVEDIYNMTMGEQLELTDKYLGKYLKTKDENNYIKLRIAVVFPVALKYINDDYKVILSNETEYGKKVLKYNPYLDLDKDGIVYVTELKKRYNEEEINICM